MPAETTADAKQIEFAVEQESNEVFASADEEEEKEERKENQRKRQEKEERLFLKVFGSK